MVEAFFGDVRHGNVEKVVTALNNGMYVDIMNMNSATALIIASMWGRIRIVSILLELGASVTHRNFMGYTALMYAQIKGYKEIVKLLKK